MFGSPSIPDVRQCISVTFCFKYTSNLHILNEDRFVKIYINTSFDLPVGTSLSTMLSLNQVLQQLHTDGYDTQFKMNG